MDQALKLHVELPPCVLAVDDELFNLEILEELLLDAGYQVDVAENGHKAMEMLESNPNKYHTVLLDRMMPELDGLEVLRKMKGHHELRFIPVIMQTAKATVGDIQEGLSVGVIYYLTKPFEKNTLLDIVSTSVASYLRHLELCHNLDASYADIKQREFSFRKLEEARSLAVLLSSLCPDPKRVVPGLSELLINAVEHGILGIGFDAKSILLRERRWYEEIETRSALVENRDKKAKIVVEQSSDKIQFTITDPGPGFDHEKFLHIDPERAVNTHGRGIVVARAVSFDELTFITPGNCVVASVSLTGNKA